MIMAYFKYIIFKYPETNDKSFLLLLIISLLTGCMVPPRIDPNETIYDPCERFRKTKRMWSVMTDQPKMQFLACINPDHLNPEKVQPQQSFAKEVGTQVVPRLLICPMVPVSAVMAPFFLISVTTVLLPLELIEPLGDDCDENAERNHQQ